MSRSIHVKLTEVTLKGDRLLSHTYGSSITGTQWQLVFLNDDKQCYDCMLIGWAIGHHLLSRNKFWCTLNIQLIVAKFPARVMPYNGYRYLQGAPYRAKQHSKNNGTDSWLRIQMYYGLKIDYDVLQHD